MEGAGNAMLESVSSDQAQQPPQQQTTLVQPPQRTHLTHYSTD